MKTLLNNKTLLIAMVLVIGIAFAGFAEDAMYIDADGNVGIGTTSAKGKFSVSLGNSDMLNIYQPSDNRLAIQTTLDNQPIGTYGGNANNILCLQPSVGNVGIGTTNPNAKLDVAGDIQFNSTIKTPGRMHITGGELCYILNKSGVIIGKEWGGNGYLQVQGNLDVFGNIKSNTGIFFSGTRSNFFLALQGDRNMVLYDNGGCVWHASSHISDIRLKKDIKNLEPVLDIVNNLNAIRFRYKKGVYNDKPQIGLVAQELEESFPELIYTDTSSGRKLIDYDKVSVILLQAIKEQQNSINELQSELASLTGNNIQQKSLWNKITGIFK